MAKHYDYRLRVSLKPAQVEAQTLAYLKGEGSIDMAEAYRVVSAVQIFYGTEAAAALGSEETRKIAMESIGLLLEQCVTVADQGGIDLEQLSYEPSVLRELIRESAERRDPLRRRKRKVRVTEDLPEATTGVLNPVVEKAADQVQSTTPSKAAQPAATTPPAIETRTDTPPEPEVEQDINSKPRRSRIAY